MKTLLPFLLAMCFATSLAQGIKATAEQPNIVLLYIDDWAWNGSPVAMNDTMKNLRLNERRRASPGRLMWPSFNGGNMFTSPVGFHRITPIQVVARQWSHGLLGISIAETSCGGHRDSGGGQFFSVESLGLSTG